MNMDLEEAARKIGISPDRLAQWEAGLTKPTVNQARNMAKVYKRPLASFYLPERPTSLGLSVPHDFRRLPDDQPKELSPELIVELRRIEYLREAAVELADDVEQEACKFIKSIRLEDPIQSVAKRISKLLGINEDLRSHWHTIYDAFNGWRNAIESQGVLVMHLNKVEVQELRGIAIAEEIFPLIAVNGKDSVAGRIFTLIHEFVHLTLGATGMSNLILVTRPTTTEQRVEQFCNQVAGEILVPRQTLQSHKIVRTVSGETEWSEDDINKLAEHFKVSREVVVRRLVILGMATNEFYRRKREQYALEREEAEGLSGWLPWPRRILRAIGEPFARIALDAYYREAITGSDLAELLGAKLKHLQGIEQLIRDKYTIMGTGG